MKNKKRRVYRFKGSERITKAYSELYKHFPDASTSGSTAVAFAKVKGVKVATLSEYTPDIYQLRLE